MTFVDYTLEDPKKDTRLVEENHLPGTHCGRV